MRNLPPLNALRAFEAAARHLSFTKAAEELRVTQSAVSQQVLKDEYAIYYSTDPGPTVSAIIARIETHGDNLIDLRVERPSLEERFLEITGTGDSR